VNRRVALLSSIASLCVLTACAPSLARLPTGPGTPFPDFAAALTQARAHCADVRTMRAVLSISGRAGRRLRAKIDAGFEAPAKIRLELPAPGKPLFVFVANGDTATLVLPRDSRVLRNAPPAATLEALAGVRLDPRELRTIVSGCGIAGDQANEARAYGAGMVAMNDVAGDATTWLQQVDGAWRIIASTRDQIDIRYADFAGGRPSTIRLRTSAKDDHTTDLTIRLSQVDVNETLDAAVFEIEIPADAVPLTLEEVRQSGPLGK
jgi:outer membrane lipoprotein-sorting protein